MVTKMIVGNNVQLTPVVNGAIPCEGQKAAPFNLDFASADTWVIDFTQPQQQKQITTIQTVYVDNSGSDEDMIFTVETTQQRFVAPARTCGFYAIIAPTPTNITVVSASAIVQYVCFLNYYIPPTVWSVPV